MIGEDGVATHAGDSRKEFQCSGTVATIIASLATTPEKERKMRITTGDRLHRVYTRDSDTISRSLNSTPATSMASTAMNTEFMRLVHIIALKYDSALSDTDLHIVTFDMLHYAPAETFDAVHPAPMSEIQLDQATDILEQADDYMRANNIAPKIISTGDAIRSINADNAALWGRRH